MSRIRVVWPFLARKNTIDAAMAVPEGDAEHSPRRDERLIDLFLPAGLVASNEVNWQTRLPLRK